ncbi:MAG: CoA-binding protein [Candidatus Omnitrophica bacterium]|nr:CoA-binding protein [Candidatus Omnitrophota bacterium]MDD5429325.1 CoA-binding protein [Candidatus Omnitrophota bacterium]
MENLIKSFFEQKTFVIAGSFRDETKYAYKILKILIKKGRQVYPVNPGISEVEGLRCYKNISDIPFEIDGVSLVTPPAISEQLLKQCLEKHVKIVWFQPGAESEAAIKSCRDNSIKAIHGLCLMLESL